MVKSGLGDDLDSTQTDIVQCQHFQVKKPADAGFLKIKSILEHVHRSTNASNPSDLGKTEVLDRC